MLEDIKLLLGPAAEGKDEVIQLLMMLFLKQDVLISTHYIQLLLKWFYISSIA